jgi:hypothetical protein
MSFGTGERKRVRRHSVSRVANANEAPIFDAQLSEELDFAGEGRGEKISQLGERKTENTCVRKCGADRYFLR